LDLTALVLEGRHPVLELGALHNVFLPYSIGVSAATHTNGAPLAHDAVIHGIRFTVGLDEMGSITHWSIKHSLQDEDRAFILLAGTRAINLWEVTAFGFMALLEECNIAYSREIWNNAVCVVTVLSSGVSLSFDLAPSKTMGPALIQKAEHAMFIGGDVFRWGT
jgi:hypothetical protein